MAVCSLKSEIVYKMEGKAQEAHSIWCAIEQVQGKSSTHALHVQLILFNLSFLREYIDSMRISNEDDLREHSEID